MSAPPRTSISTRPMSSSRNTSERSAEGSLRRASCIAPKRQRREGGRYVYCSRNCRRFLMWNKDEVKGKADQAAGRVKRAVGDATDNEDLQAEGDAQEAGGVVQGGFGKARREVGNAIKDVGDAIKR